MAQNTDEQLQALIDQIGAETQAGANTKTRIATLLTNLKDSKAHVTTVTELAARVTATEAVTTKNFGHRADLATLEAYLVANSITPVAGMNFINDETGTLWRYDDEPAGWVDTGTVAPTISFDATPTQGSTNKAVTSDGLFTEFAKTLQLTNSTTENTFQAYRIPAPNNENGGIDIVNFGNPGLVDQTTFASLLATNMFFGRMCWSGEWGLNVKWNNTTKKWNYDLATEPSCMLEVGREGVTAHAQKAGVHLNDSWHALFQVRASGPAGRTGTNYEWVVQPKTTIFATYQSGTYNSDQHPWAGGTTLAENPFIHLHSNEIKGSNVEFMTLENNHNTATGGAGFYFKRSRGSLASKSNCQSGDRAGGFYASFYGGTGYNTGALILFELQGAASAGQAPTKTVFMNRNTSGSLAARFTIHNDGKLEATTAGVPTYADDAAAGTGGLTAGMFYKTATGQLMIKL